MIPDISQAAQEISDVLKFENWMRFYFAKEQDGKLVLEIPEEWMENIRKDTAKLTRLAEELNGEEIDQKKCYEAVCTFVSTAFDGSKYPAGVTTSVLDSKDFQIETHLFNLWVQGHEALLDQKILPYPTWREMFDEWKEEEKVRDYIDKLRASPGAGSGEPQSPTAH